LWTVLPHPLVGPLYGRQNRLLWAHERRTLSPGIGVVLSRKGSRGRTWHLGHLVPSNTFHATPKRQALWGHAPETPGRAGTVARAAM
jgi:hypothetical protein